MENRRHSEIDLLKCVCILTVVYGHAISTSMTVSSFLGLLAEFMTRFAVPGFLFAAGFLFDKKKGSTAQIIKKKLIRLLPPYLFCSLCFQFLNVPGLFVRLEELGAGQLIYNLIFCSTLGIYFFVFVLFYLLAGSLVLRHVPDKLVLGLWVFFALLIFVFVKVLSGYPMSFFLLLRHPLHAPFFYLFAYLSGWVFSLHYERVSSFLKKHRFGVVCGGIALVLIAIIYTRMDRNASSLFIIFTNFYVYACITILITLGLWTTKFQGGIQFVSNCSYGIYLLHFPIVRACQSVYPEISAHYSFVYAFVSWIVGTAGSILIIVIVQKLSGRNSRYLIGC